MLSRGTLKAPDKPSLKYVYIKMVTAQADTTEGKLRRGDVLLVDEEKAMRWVYRSRIAVAASKEDYDKFRDKYIRTKNGTAALPPGMRRNLFDIPDDPGFTYAESDPTEAHHDDTRSRRKKATDDDEDGLTPEQQETDLAHRLMEAAKEDEEDEEDEEDDDDLPPDPQSVSSNSPHSQPPQFSQRMERGPTTSNAPTVSSRPSRARTGASARAAQGNGPDDTHKAPAKK